MGLKSIFLGVIFLGTLLISSCEDSSALAMSSFGAHQDAKASQASVISMGRDDDDGLARKWHIGGGE